MIAKAARYARDLPSVVKAAGTWLLVEHRLRRYSLGEVCGSLGIGQPGSCPSALAGDPEALAEDLRRAERGVAVLLRLGLPLNCLRQTLVRGSMLRAHQPVLAISARLTPEPAAHAWLKIGALELGRDQGCELVRP